MSDLHNQRYAASRIIAERFLDGQQIRENPKKLNRQSERGTASLATIHLTAMNALLHSYIRCMHDSRPLTATPNFSSPDLCYSFTDSAHSYLDYVKKLVQVKYAPVDAGKDIRQSHRRQHPPIHLKMHSSNCKCS
jgi:hypothetical protein